MKRITICVLVLIVVSLPAQARVQRKMICWVPDCEFPVDCDEDE